MSIINSIKKEIIEKQIYENLQWIEYTHCISFKLNKMEQLEIEDENLKIHYLENQESKIKYLSKKEFKIVDLRQEQGYTLLFVEKRN